MLAYSLPLVLRPYKLSLAKSSLRHAYIILFMIQLIGNYSLRMMNGILENEVNALDYMLDAIWKASL